MMSQAKVVTAPLCVEGSVWQPPTYVFLERTSLCYLGEGQTRTSLEIDIVGEDESAQSSERFAREKVCFTALRDGQR